MPIGLTDDHRELAGTVRAFLADRAARAATRALLEAPTETLPGFWKEFADLGLLGLHVPEEYGGGGAGLGELAVVVEELGRAVAPGPVVPTMIAAAVIAARGSSGQRARLLPGLVDGATPAAVGLDAVAGADAAGAGADESAEISGEAVAVLGAGLADLLLLPVGDDLVVIPARAPGVTVRIPPNLDPGRRSGRVTLDRVRAEVVLPGARPLATAIARTLLAAEAVGGAQECVETATGYAKTRTQFGRPIGAFQAVKHHCANMLVDAELAAAATWDAARAATGPEAGFELAAAVALTLAVPAFASNASLNVQVHGGIGFTWEHDAHLLLRRAVTLEALTDPAGAARDVTRLRCAGVSRRPRVAVPAAAETARADVHALAQELAPLPAAEQRRRLIETGYVQPHWPRPFGLAAEAGLQLVIEEEFAAAGVRLPDYGITGWVLLTIIQHGTSDQVRRWVRPALAGDEIWCQLFSEPEAGSDAAAVRTRGARVEGGWMVSGQKVWTSGAQHARRGLATVRTDPQAPKHQGITMMAIDFGHPGVQVRPLRMPTGAAEFNEVFLTDVFVPDQDVVGELNHGWKVARSTLGNERVSIGGQAPRGFQPPDLLALPAAARDRVPAAAERFGRHAAEEQALRLLNLRRAERALAGAEPGPEGNVTKLALAEHAQRAALLVTAMAGAEAGYVEGLGGAAGMARLSSRVLSIAGGTSEITRNQIGERILGLPRDPLLR